MALRVGQIIVHNETILGEGKNPGDPVRVTYRIFDMDGNLILHWDPRVSCCGQHEGGLITSRISDWFGRDSS